MCRVQTCCFLLHLSKPKSRSLAVKIIVASSLFMAAVFHAATAAMLFSYSNELVWFRSRKKALGAAVGLVALGLGTGKHPCLCLCLIITNILIHLFAEVVSSCFLILGSQGRRGEPCCLRIFLALTLAKAVYSISVCALWTLVSVTFFPRDKEASELAATLTGLSLMVAGYIGIFI